MARKLNPICWLGRGCLHLRVDGRIRVIVPNMVVEDPAELESLGGDRIAEILADGTATKEIEIDLGGGFRGRRMVDPAVAAEGLAAQAIAQESWDRNTAAEARAQDVRDKERRRVRDMLAAGVTVPPAQTAGV